MGTTGNIIQYIFHNLGLFKENCKALMLTLDN